MSVFTEPIHVSPQGISLPALIQMQATLAAQQPLYSFPSGIGQTCIQQVDLSVQQTSSVEPAQPLQVMFQIPAVSLHREQQVYAVRGNQQSSQPQPEQGE